MGFGLLADTNRFDTARGFGAFVRIIDTLSPFIVSYATVVIAKENRYILIKYATLLLFIIYVGFVNGAKVSFLLNLSVIMFTLSIFQKNIKYNFKSLLAGIILSLLFSVAALSINLKQNDVGDEIAQPLGESFNSVSAAYIYRLLAFGDTSYLIIPNDVIDNLETDGILERFAAPIIGSGNLSNIIGYDVTSYSVGRQAILYHSPDLDVAGGPTSHFDYFAYVYFGAFGGALVVLFLGYLLGAVNRAAFFIKERNKNKEMNINQIALVSALWSRVVAILVEPPVGIAYLLDFIIIYGVLYFLSKRKRVRI